MISDIYENCILLLYADDLNIFRDVRDYEKIPKDLNNFTKWCYKNSLLLNIAKCKVKRFHRTSQLILFNYSLNNSFLEQTTLFKDLGIFFDPTLSFKSHCNFICNKAIKLPKFDKLFFRNLNNLNVLLQIKL